MSGIIGSRLNIRGSGLVGSLGTDGQVLTSSGAGVGAVYEAAAGGMSVSDITGATALGAQPATDDELVLSDAGTLKRADYKYINPSSSRFQACMSDDHTMTHDTLHKIPFNVEIEDVDSEYDESSNYRWTVGVGGAYLIGYKIAFRALSNDDTMHGAYLHVYKNGAHFHLTSTKEQACYGSTHADGVSLVMATGTFTFNFSASDYLEMYGLFGHVDGGANTCKITHYYTNWWGIRL